MTMSGRKPKRSSGAGAMAMDDEYQDMIRNVPQQDPARPGWLRQRSGDGGFIMWPIESRPTISADHIDGPLLHFRNGELHWLTPWERFLFWIGMTDAADLEYKYRPELCEPPR